MVSMKPYLETLHFLNQRKPDRIYLNDFDLESNEKIINLTKNKASTILEHSFHETFYKFLNTSDLIFLFSSFRLDKFDTVELVLKTSFELDPKFINAYFSQHSNGVIPYQYVYLDDESRLNNDGWSHLKFCIVDEDGADNSIFLHNIKCFSVDLGVDCDVEIHDVFVSQKDYELTLEDIDSALVNAREYLSRELDDEGLVKLKHLIFKVAAAKLWLIKWGEEGESAGETGSFSTKSYHDKLLEDVVKELDEYLDSINESDDVNYLNTKMVGYYEGV